MCAGGCAGGNSIPGASSLVVLTPDNRCDHRIALSVSQPALAVAVADWL